ncbi:MAG TPA: GNAT family N-acetyltransferase [Galbitalea sp.]|nr:GNAT family N-acetyltransferase [Galbitalea sp.]
MVSRVPLVVAGTPAAVPACVDLWIRALAWRDGLEPAEAVHDRTAGKLETPAIRFAIVGEQSAPTAFALTTRLSESSADEKEQPAAAHTAYIELLAVEPAVVSRGLGRALLRDAIVAASAARCTMAVLHVRVDNTAAIHLYESEGFEMRGEPREHAYSRAPMIEMRRPLRP